MGRLPVLVLVWALAFPAAAVAGAPPGGDGMQRHAESVTTFTTFATQIFGPLPAVASTPFFGLAILSGVALASGTEAAQSSDWRSVAAVRDNLLVREARHWATPGRFGLLLGLALLGWLVNSGKIQGLVGKVFRLLEDSSVLIGYTLLAIAALPDPDAASLHPGRETAWHVLVPIATALALATMMAVRFAFDVLIWLSPFPLVDFGFEVVKKLSCAALLLLYVWNPGAAAFVCAIALGIALLIGGWAFRVLAFYARILLNPLLASAFPALRPPLVDAAAAHALGLPGDLRLACPAVALSVRSWPKRVSCLVVVAADGTASLESRGWRERRTAPLPRPGERLVIGRALGWVELRVVDTMGRTLDTIAFSKLLLVQIEALAEVLRADDGGSFGLQGAIEAVGDAAGRAWAARD